MSSPSQTFSAPGTGWRSVRWWAYALAVLLAVGALLVRWGLDAWLGNSEVWPAFYLAVAMSAWWLGWRPAVLTALVGLLLGIFFLLPPRQSWQVYHLYEWVAMATYLFVAAAIVLLVRTARRQQRRLRAAAQNVAQELEFSQAVVDSLPGLFYMLDEEGRLRRWNKRAEALSGYSAAEMEGKPGAEMVPPEEREAVAEKMREVFTVGRAQAEMHFYTRDGRRLPHFFTGRRFTYGGRTRLVGTGVDIAERQQAEAALRRQNQRLAVLQEAAIRLLSSPEPERVLPELLDRIDQDFGVDIFVEFGLSRDGEHLELRSCGGLDQASQDQLRHLELGQGVCGSVAQTRQPRAQEAVQGSADPSVQLIRGLGVRAYACTPLLVEGRLHGTLSFGSRRRDRFEPEDLTFFQALAGCVALARERAGLLAQLQAHAAELEQRVDERTARLREAVAEMEQMSYTMIHDLRAPLRAIESFGGILAQRAAAGLGPEGRDLVAKMRTAATRMDHLVREALNYNQAVRTELPLRPVDLGVLTRGIVQTYPDFQPPQAEVELAPELPTVLGNEAALTQCLSHLLLNAVKFAKPGTRPHVRIWAEEGRDGERAVPQEPRAEKRQPRTGENVPLAPNRGDGRVPDQSPTVASSLRPPQSAFARLWVEDEGIGIEPATQATLFKLFERVSTQGKGTGMGLAIVAKAMERMGGRVGVKSAPGRGSRFWLDLQCAPE